MVHLQGRLLFSAVTALTCLGFLLIGLYAETSSNLKADANYFRQ